MRVEIFLDYLILSNIHTISEAEESVIIFYRVLIEAIDIFLAHEGTHENQ